MDKKRTLRKPAGVAAIGLAVLAVVLAVGGNAKPPQPRSEESAVTVSAPTAVVVEAETPEILEAPGIVKAKLSSTLSAKVMGRVLAVNVREGERVRTGQPLVLVDAADLSAAVDVSAANYRAAVVGLENSRTASAMEAQTSSAKLQQASAQVQQARAALSAATARLQLAQAGPRVQERTQAKLAVTQASANLKLADSELVRQRRLYEHGASAKRQVELAQNAYDVAKAQYDTAVEANAIAAEGSRSQEIWAAEEAVRQARAAVAEAEAGQRQAKAGLLQAKLSKDEIQAAAARVSQTAAAKRMAVVTRSYARVTAPFDGVVVARMVDPGAQAAPGTPLVTLEGGPIRLESVVPEGALRKVKVGMVVPVVVDAVLSAPVDGQVVEIVPKGDASTHSFLVRVEIPKSSGALAGMYGRAMFATGNKKRVLAPTDAVFERSGLHYVYSVNSAGTVRLRLITVGERFGNRTEVLSGLNPGDTVVTGNLPQVTDGATLVGQGRR